MSDQFDLDGAVVVDLQGFMRRVGLSKQTCNRLIALGDAPPRIQLSARRFGFRLRDIDQWVEARKQPVC